MKLLLTVLILIVLPTAWLSLLAGRSIHARELLLDRRLEAEAQQEISQVGDTIRQLIIDQLPVLVEHAQRTILVGQPVPAFGAAVASSRLDHSFYETIFLFLNPWGLVYPELSQEASGALEERYVLLTQELAVRLVRGSQVFVFGVGREVYAFGLVAGTPDLYVGYALNEAALRAQIERLLRQRSSAHIEYRLLRLGAVSADPSLYAADQTVEVRDNLTEWSATTAPISAEFRRDIRRHPEVLYRGVLPEPFEHVEIGAFAVNAHAMYASRALQTRLVRWSILLLAFVLLASTTILISMARRQARDARIRSIFIAGLSHDIRTPITAMRALAESLQQGRVGTEERRQQFLDSIVSECDRLQTLVERVLLFFRQEQGKSRYHKTDVALVPLCERVCETFCARYRGRVDLRFDTAEGRAPRMWADASAIEQALHNLLENAWKYGRPESYSPDQVLPIRLELSVTDGRFWGRCVQIAVEDGGSGVPRAERSKIFRRFYRVGADRHAFAGGIGLGLALVAEIVRSHRGRVRVEQSEALGGARFVLRFGVLDRMGTWAG